MIRIGDFARLGNVSVVTLRHYDDVGLLKPATVDRFTGYRYYSAGQLARLNRIVALKDLGFSLKQIEELLDGVTVEQLGGMLKLKHAQAELRLANEQTRLARIAARLKHIELENTMPDYGVILKDTPAMLIASRRVIVPTNNEVPRVLGEAFDAAYAFVQKGGAKESGPCLALWHQAADVYENEDVEAGVTIDRQITGTEAVRVYELPLTTVACVIHQGDFSGMQQAHVALLGWIEANGYRPTGGYREIYLESDDANRVTEIQYPIARN